MRLLEEDEFSEYIKNHMSIPKYDSKREGKIPNAYWDLDTERISSILRQMEVRLCEIIQRFPDSDKELHHLLAQLHKIPHYERKKPTAIGLIGAQGHGKSMLINALFELDGISLTGKLGGALTSTVVKYAQYSSTPRSANTPAYNGEIQFLDEMRIGEMIREHVKDYAHYHDDGEDSEDDDTLGPRDFKQDDADRKRRDTAMEVFETLFGTKEDFFEECANAESKNEFVRICQIRCKDIIRDHKVDDRYIARKYGNTPSDLLLELKPFLVDEKGPQKLWPLVDYVTIRLDHELLRNGATIIDVPGTGDSNILRARRAEEIKESADILNTVKNCILNRGYSNVKLVATQIDVKQVRERMKKASEDAKAAMQILDAQRMMHVSMYQEYPNRHLLQLFVTNRASDISAVLGHKLNGRSTSEMLEIFHISAYNYLKWVARPEIPFLEQPPLPPSLTGIPALRQYLFDVLAPTKYHEIASHVHMWIPNFIEKVKRVVNQSDRNEDFKTLAKGFDQLVDKVFRKIFYDTSTKCRNNADIYKQQVDEMIEVGFARLRGPTWNKVLKLRGTLPPRASKAKGLEGGCSYNKDLSGILAHVHFSVMSMLDTSSANVMVVEQAKRKWGIVRKKLHLKMEDLMNELYRIQQQAVLRATMEDGRQNCLVAAITDTMFNDVFASEPASKPGCGDKKKFVEPKVKYQKRLMTNLLLDPDNHIVDHVFKQFHEEYTKATNNLLQLYFQQLRDLLGVYSNTLRAQAPIDYRVENAGKEVRAELEKDLVTIIQESETLKELVPEVETQSEVTDNMFSMADMGESDGNLAAIFSRLSKKRKKDTDNASQVNVKKEKM
ncbi:hypothetical protein P171DRAFT_452610 [Karstenula rhodostoma CBS 690.94]|uniref:P-loop containing nucleoside triphosphate hydrolase protein n=1 Tax=Karstenula rhodostoma CBS 690.94 TaxID=1392251 RepID=A0A9P4UGW0_9PLEO|nr:hypothetical protein P171DRAFT_452610 [Karstenula rhodostoma CBS 690.94]